MNVLTADEIAFLNKIEQNKQKHRQAQTNYRASNKDKIAEYNKKYNEDQKAKIIIYYQNNPKHHNRHP